MPPLSPFDSFIHDNMESTLSAPVMEFLFLSILFLLVKTVFENIYNVAILKLSK